MKTQTTTEAPAAGSQPGNLTTRALASALARTPAEGEATAAAAKKDEKAGAEPEAPERKQARTETQPEPDETNEAQTETEGAESETTEPSAETEQTEQTEEAPEPEPEEARASGELPEELQDAIELAKADGKSGTAKLLKRVHKLVDERDTQRNARLSLEEENRQLKDQLQNQRTEDGPRTETSPVHPEVARVSGELRNVDHWLNWCEEHAEGGAVPDGKGGEVELDGAKVKAIRRDLEHQRTELVARKVQTERDVRAALATAYQQHHTQAVEMFRWLEDQKSPEYQEMQAILKVFPALKQAPDHEVVLGHYFRGKALAAAEAKAKARPNGTTRKPAAAREPTRVMAEPPGGGADTTPTSEKAAKDSEKKFKSSGRTADLAKLFATRARATR